MLSWAHLGVERGHKELVRGRHRHRERVLAVDRVASKARKHIEETTRHRQPKLVGQVVIWGAQARTYWGTIL